MKISIFLIINLILISTILIFYFQKKSSENDLVEEKLLNFRNIIEIKPDYFLTAISMKTSDDNKKNYLFGVFESSKDKLFNDTAPIAVILEKFISDGQIFINIHLPKSYKYIRYIPPDKSNSSNISLKLHYNKKDVNNENYYQITNLPLISINTENETEPIKSEDINCVIKIIDDKKLVINEEGEIKIRGRSTSLGPKKPFRIKFSKKQQIFNFEGKEKKWNLLANYYDTSLLRNDVAFKISELMKYDFTPRCKPVDLILNGKFLGSYQLCDKIEVGENRVNITKMKKKDINEPEISGGYFLRLDALAKENSGANYLKTNKGMIISLEYPEEDDITEEQRSYIFGKVNKMENEVYNNNISSLDLYTYSKSFLANEFIGNPDHLYSNFYFTKERNDDKFKFGPLWDFDLAFDNDKRLYPTNNKTNFCFNFIYASGTAITFAETLLQNQNVKEEIKKTWKELCNNTLNSTYLLNYIEERKKYIEESASLNYLRWYDVTEEIIFGIYNRFQSLEESVESLKEYIKRRVDSLTNLLNKKLG